MIALKQIITLDKPVDKLWLYEKFKIWEKDSRWCDRTLTYLHSNKIIIDITEIRALHLESASRIIANFLNESTHDECKIFYKLIQDEFISNECSLRGIIWFLNLMFAYDCSHSLYYFVLTQTTVTKIIERCFQANSSEEQASAAHIMEFIATRKYGLLSFEEIINRYSILSEWIENVDGKTAYAYSNILNGMHNENPSLQLKFTSNLKISRIAEQMSLMDENDLYGWGRFIDRLVAFQSKKWRKNFYEVLPIENFQNNIDNLSPDKIGGFIEFLSGMYLLNQKYSHAKLIDCIPKIKVSFEKNLSETWAEFDFSSMWRFFGFNSLSRSRPNSLQRETTKKIILQISEEVFADCITYGKPRDWQRIFSLAYLIDKYDKPKIIKAVTAVNFEVLDITSKGLWATQPHELMLLCDILASGDSNLTSDWVFSHRQEIEVLCSTLAVISPKTVEYLINNERKVELCSGHWWATSANAIKRLIAFDKRLAINVIKQNRDTICSKLSNLERIDCEEIHLFIKAIIEADSITANTIFDCIDISIANIAWEKCTKEQYPHEPKSYIEGLSKLLKEIQHSTKNNDLLSLIHDVQQLISLQASNNS